MAKKSAIIKINEQTKAKNRRVREASRNRIKKYDDRLKRQLKARYQEIDKRQRYLSREMRHALKAEARRENKIKSLRYREHEKIASSTLQHQNRTKAAIQKETVKNAARVLAKREGKKYRDVVTRSPRKLTSAGKMTPTRGAPKREDFLKVICAGRLGRGLDYHIPVNYDAYLRDLRTARKTGLAWAYMIYLVSRDRRREFKSALLSHSTYIGEELSEAEFDELIRDKIVEIKNTTGSGPSGGMKNPKPKGLVMHYTALVTAETLKLCR